MAVTKPKTAGKPKTETKLKTVVKPKMIAKVGKAATPVVAKKTPKIQAGAVKKSKKAVQPSPIIISKTKMTDGKVKKSVKIPATEKSASQKPKKSIKKKKQYLNGLIEKRTRNFGIGMDFRPKRNMSRFLRWPKYVRLQRQEKILKKRLKIPPSLNQFKMSLNRNLTLNLFTLLHKYRPETKEAKKLRLKKLASLMAKKKISESSKSKKTVKVTEKAKKKTEKPQKKASTTTKVKSPKKFLRKGIHEVTSLVEKKKAKLVVIAHDVEPIEIVVWLPALCRKMNVPYCIVKGKSRLGKLVHRKTVSCICLTDVKPKDKVALTKLVECIRPNFNDRSDEVRRMWGAAVPNKKSSLAKKK